VISLLRRVIDNAFGGQHPADERMSVKPRRSGNEAVGWAIGHTTLCMACSPAYANPPVQWPATCWLHDQDHPERTSQSRRVGHVRQTALPPWLPWQLPRNWGCRRAWNGERIGTERICSPHWVLRVMGGAGAESSFDDPAL
jgi:hypothetical protein